MIKVLTIEREYGSGAAEVAQRLAGHLGWKLWDQSLTNEISRRLECDSQFVEQHEERKDPLYHRLFKSFLRGSIEGSLNAPRRKMAVRLTTYETGRIRFISSSMRRSKNGYAGCRRRARVRRKRFNSPTQWTATARLSSSNTSASSGRPASSST
jgi:hypothetical protein